MIKASCIPKSSTLVDDCPEASPLSRAPVGQPLAVLRIDGAGRAELEREGVLPGVTLVVAARTPLGGPIVVELGRARLALSADMAGQVLTAPSPPRDDRR